jgi:choline/glycine/proline betaine transport protein
MSLYRNLEQDTEWQAEWTLFYWGWWISWSPFVAVFIARISKGRTIGEFVTGVLLVPPLATFCWISVFGGTGLYMQAIENIDMLGPITDNVATSLHILLQQLPYAMYSMILGTIVIVIFFITSSDSGSLVDDMVTSGGNPNPPRIQRVCL